MAGYSTDEGERIKEQDALIDEQDAQAAAERAQLAAINQPRYLKGNQSNPSPYGSISLPASDEEDADTGTPGVSDGITPEYAQLLSEGPTSPSVPRQLSQSPVAPSAASSDSAAVPQMDVKSYITQRLAEQNQGLAAAQAQTRQNQGYAGIAEGLGQIAGAGQSTPFNPAGFAFLHKNASQPTEDYLAQRKNNADALTQVKAEMSSDPTSPESVIARNLLRATLKHAKMDPNMVTDQMSADQLKSATPLAKDLNDTENKRMLASQLAGIRGEAANARRTAADQKLDTDWETGLSKDAKGGYVQASHTIDMADSMKNKIQNATTNPSAFAALPTEMGNWASQGQRLHQATVEAFMHPDQSFGGRFATALSKGARGTLPQDIANQMIQMVDEEQQKAIQQRNSVRGKSAQVFNKIHGRLPKQYDPSEAAPALTSKTSSALPEQGAIEEYGGAKWRFKGGNPSDKNAWEPAQ